MKSHRVPKHTYVGWQTFEIGVYDAVTYFNIGNLATLRIFKSLGTEPLTYTRLARSALNKDKVENTRRHNKVTFKLRRRIIRGNRKRKADQIEGVEGKLYFPGIANWIYLCWKIDVLFFSILLFWCFNLFGRYIIYTWFTLF